MSDAPLLTLDLGDYTQGEIPDPLSYIMLDYAGDPIDLTGLTGAFDLRRLGDSIVHKTGAGVVDIDPDQVLNRGRITWTAAAGDFDDAGLYVGEFIAASVSDEHRSVRLTWRVHSAVESDPVVSMVGLCELWATADDLDKCGGVPLADFEVLERCLAVASRVCFLLGGSRWPGVCEDSVLFADDHGCVLPYPVRGGVGLVGSVSAGRTALWRRTLRLPQTPIVEVTEVRVDGDVLDPSAYRIVDDALLVRVDGGSWVPGRIDDDTPRLEVDYTWGSRPSELGRRAAAMLTRELALSVCQPDACRLDRRVQSIVREGVTMDVALPGLVDALVQGQIGVPEVDLFVTAENPAKLRREGRIVIPGNDDGAHRVR